MLCKKNYTSWGGYQVWLRYKGKIMLVLAQTRARAIEEAVNYQYTGAYAYGDTVVI